MKGVHPSRIPPNVIKETFDTYTKHNNSVRSTATVLGISRAAVRNHIDLYQDSAEASVLEMPIFPPANLPIETIIASMAERSSIRRASYDAHTWFPVKVRDKLPIGVMFFGDPHIDDDGCDWKLLQSHIDLCKKPGVYGANIGDTTNNWAGRLVTQYAKQETSAATARRLAEWFMLDAGIKWLVFLLGNHDQWADGSALLAQMAKRHATQQIIMHDWEARFSLNFPNGQKINIWTAHDFPGDSMWNPLHGPVKAARFGPDVDLLVCGHKHNYGVSQWELADKGTSPIMVRVRGYKFNDDYARRIGKQDQQGGSSVFTIFNPQATTREGRIIPFVDVETGVDYLQFLRAKV